MERAAWSNENHPITIELNKELEAAETTADMMNAYAHARDEWDKLLNENYKALMGKLSKEQQDKLRASQREWIKFRDLEYEFNADYLLENGGSGARVGMVAFQCDFVRDRALALGTYLEEPEEGDVW
jgi:uncharacterized protein YecT (DUF1311 family)